MNSLTSCLDVQNVEVVSTPAEQLCEELNVYNNIAVPLPSKASTNTALEFWKANQCNLPFLTHLAKLTLSCPAAAAMLERVNSLAKFSNSKGDNLSCRLLAQFYKRMEQKKKERWYDRLHVCKSCYRLFSSTHLYENFTLITTSHYTDLSTSKVKFFCSCMQNEE